MKKECEYFYMECCKDTPVDSLNCVRCLIVRANEFTSVVDILMLDNIEKRDRILEGIKEAKEWVVKNL